MKTITIIYPLTLALAVALASTGCKHQPTKLTHLPAPVGPPVSEAYNPPPTLPPGNTVTPDQLPSGNNVPPPNTTDGHYPTTSDWDPKLMTEDRGALAAYTVHFAFDSAAVKSSEQSNLQSVAAALASDVNVKLMIEGNCDERGTEEYNRSLGERRALALREALAKLNVDPQRVRTISFGKDKPADTGHDEAAFAKNRRGDFVLYHPKGGV
jgi:peptidoglycan-associated lipoprotein